MMENGIVTYFPFAFKMVILTYIAALLFKPIRNFLAPTSEDESHKWYFILGRLTISTLILILPFAYDHFVPEVAGDIRWYMIHFSGLALISLFFVYLYVSNKKGEKFILNLKFTPTTWAVIITVAFGFLTLIWGISLPNNWWFLKNLVGYALIFAFVLQLKNEEWYKNLMWLLAIGVCFNAFLGILQYFAVSDSQILRFLHITQADIKAYVPFADNLLFINFFQQAAPPAGAFANKNLAASYMLMCLPLMVYLMVTSTTRLKLILSSISFTLAGIFLIYTRSRGSWLSAIAVLIFAALWLILNKGDRQALCAQFNTKKFIALITSVIIIIYASSFSSKLIKANGNAYHSLDTTVSSQLSSIANISKKELSVRSAYNINGIDILLDNPMGVGLGAFHTIYPQYFKSSAITPKVGYNLSARPRRMHNDMFQAFIELGILGGMAHLFIFMSPLYMARRISKNEKIPNKTKALSFFVLIGIAGICVNSLGDFPLQMPTAPAVLWLLVAIITGLYVTHIKPDTYGLQLKTPLAKKTVVALLALISLAPLCFVTYDNYQRREGALYLKPALGLSRTGKNNDVALHFINKSYDLYDLNPRTREMRGVIYMSHHKGLPQSNAIIGFDKRRKVLNDALKYDPNAQNTLINLAMLHSRKAQKALGYGDKEYALELLKTAFKHSYQAKSLSYYKPNANTVHGIILLYFKQNQEAYNNFKKASKLDPNFKPAQQYLKKMEPQVKSGLIQG